MIVLLSYSTSYCKTKTYNFTPTGELNKTVIDSARIAYSDLRTVNCKLLELKYSKQTNIELYKIIKHDSLQKVTMLNQLELDKQTIIDYDTSLTKQKKNNKIYKAGSLGFILLLIVTIIK